MECWNGVNLFPRVLLFLVSQFYSCVILIYFSLLYRDDPRSQVSTGNRRWIPPSTYKRDAPSNENKNDIVFRKVCQVFYCYSYFFTSLCEVKHKFVVWSWLLPFPKCYHYTIYSFSIFLGSRYPKQTNPRKVWEVERWFAVHRVGLSDYLEGSDFAHLWEGFRWTQVQFYVRTAVQASIWRSPQLWTAN